MRDFVGKIILIFVFIFMVLFLFREKTNKTDEISEREIKSLLDFKDKFKKTSKLILITKNTEKQEKEISYVPLWKWLLER